jgi:hypothetical protein
VNASAYLRADWGLNPACPDNRYYPDIETSKQAIETWLKETGKYIEPTAPFHISLITPMAAQVALLPYGRAMTINKKGGLSIIATVEGQELHVSVTVPGANRLPTWEELLRVKALFWHPEADVIQFLALASEYVNLHEYCPRL